MSISAIANRWIDFRKTLAPAVSSGLLILLPWLTAGASFAQIIWDFGEESPFSAEPAEGTVPANLTVFEFTRGNHGGIAPLLSSTSASSGYEGASGAGNAGIAARTGGFDPETSAYFEFTLTPAPGHQVFLSGMAFATRSTATGPREIAIRSSLDGFAVDVASVPVNADSAWTRVEFPGLNLVSAGPLTLRLYGHSGEGTTPTSANWRVDDLRLDVAVSTTDAPAPVITSFTPAGGPPGTAVAIFGTNFGAAPAVAFGGVAAPGATVNEAGTEITVVVPANAITGPIRVTAPGGATESATLFTVETPPALTLVITPSTFAENTPPSEITATVGLPAPAAEPVTVSLTSSDTTELTVPATVTIAAGASSATFPVAPVADGEVDGDATVTVSASATGYAGASVEVTVTNVDVPSMSVVVNKYLNGEPDMVELLVVGTGGPGSAADMRGMLVKDFTAAMVNDGGGKFRFADHPLFAAVKAGTLLVLSNTAESVDTDASDYVLRLGLRDTEFFSSEGGTFNISADDLLMIKAAGAPAAGVEGAIHALAAINGAPGAQFEATASAKLLASGATNTGMGAAALNGSSSLADYNGADAIVMALAPEDFGLPNTPENEAFITTLRGAGSAPPPAGGYAAWSAAFPGVGDATEDADGDGMSNLLEYALGGVPNDPSSAPLPSLSARDGRLFLTALKGATAAADGELVYIIERSENLVDWTTEGVTTDGDATELRGSIPLPEGEGRAFLRLRVVMSKRS